MVKGDGASRMRGICIARLVILLLCVWMLGAVSPAKIHGSPANDLVALINGKRAASKLPALRNSAGLGCMALQYISECMGGDGGDACSGDNTVACQPPEAHVTEVYAANCGVELPTVDVIAGRLIGCHRERAGPEDALQAVLASATGGSSKANATEAAALSVIRGKEHTQAGPSSGASSSAAAAPTPPSCSRPPARASSRPTAASALPIASRATPRRPGAAPADSSAQRLSCSSISNSISFSRRVQ